MFLYKRSDMKGETQKYFRLFNVLDFVLPRVPARLRQHSASGLLVFTARAPSFVTEFISDIWFVFVLFYIVDGVLHIYKQLFGLYCKIAVIRLYARYSRVLVMDRRPPPEMPPVSRGSWHRINVFYRALNYILFYYYTSYTTLYYMIIHTYISQYINKIIDRNTHIHTFVGSGQPQVTVLQFNSIVQLTCKIEPCSLPSLFSFSLRFTPTPTPTAPCLERRYVPKVPGDGICWSAPSGHEARTRIWALRTVLTGDNRMPNGLPADSTRL